MAYATLDQLVSLFGADEIRTLSDRQGTGELDEAVISDALEPGILGSGQLSRGSLCDAAFGL